MCAALPQDLSALPGSPRELSGSEHPAFHGLAGLLESYAVDLLCVQETHAPEGAAPPTDQPYHYDGPTGRGGCEAGFLVHSASTSWCVPSGVPSSRISWRVVATTLDGTKVLVCSFYAPHVGVALPERLAFWDQLCASAQHVLQLHPGAKLLLAGDANVYLSEVMVASRERSCESRLRVVIRAFMQDFGLAICNPPGIPTHRSGSSIDLVFASQSLVVADVLVHDGASCGCLAPKLQPIPG